MPCTAWRGVEDSRRLGRCRWKAERLARMARLRRLAIRYEGREDIHLGFTLAAALICLKPIRRFCWAFALLKP